MAPRWSRSVGEYLRSSRGVEAVQLYGWLAKDIIWTQCAFYWGYAAAVVLAPSLLLLYWSRRNPAQCVTYLVVAAWFSANWWWMVGENWDCRFHPGQEDVEDRHANQAAALLAFAFAFFVAHQSGGRSYLHNRFPPPDDAEAQGHASPRCTHEMLHSLGGVRACVDDYESLHVLFWIGKDLAWALEAKWVWLFFAVGTLVSAADLVFLMRRDLVELTHSVVTLMWVTANVMWGATELFGGENPAPMDALPSPLTNGRWYAAWLLVAAFYPVVVLYAVWVPATLHGAAPELKTLIESGATSSSPPPPPLSTGSSIAS